MIVTVAPGAADVGVKEAMVGGRKVKVPDDVAVPPAVATEMVPVVPTANTAVMLVALTTV